MFKVLSVYKKSFQGLRKEVWWLALVTFVNRAGTMVIPFLSLYLTASLGFTLKDVGWVLTAFGLGSVIGSWIGGKLTDRIGAYPVMLWSLVLSGVLFVVIQYIESFWVFCGGIFAVMLVADTFRPALFVAINDYCLPENRTRSVSLIRLAINLGFSFGPAVGGFIIATVSYGGLFWIDGITCVMAALILVLVLPKKNGITNIKEEAIQTSVKSPYRDKVYLLFIFILVLIGFSFLQYFSTIPLYYRDYHHLTEEYVGWLMAFNGLLVFVFEMPLVKYFEKPRFNVFNVLFVSTLLFALSFFVLNIMNWWGMLVLGMMIMSFAEILNFPFLNSFAMARGQGRSLGAYMALFTMGFSVSHIVGHNAGMQLIDYIGFDATWYIMTGCLIVAALLILVLKRMVEKKE